MNNQNVIIYLNTPLVQLEKDQGEVIFQIKGKIVAEEVLGFQVQIKAVGNEKGWGEKSSLKKVFIPIHKIDYISIE